MGLFGRITRIIPLIAVTAMVVIGCSEKRTATKSKTQLTSPYGRSITVAVAPVMNFSGAADIDVIRVTDILYSELQQVDGFAVIPVNRMLAQMMREKLVAIETPQQALNLANQVGADAIVVAAITEYNPFYPPVVGMAVQLYGLDDPGAGSASKIDPVQLERQASPLKLPTDIAPRYWPKNQVQRIYNARDKTWAHEVKEFAEDRGTSNSPYEWEIYLRSQEYYLRFVCYKSIQELLTKELARIGPGIPPDRSPGEKEYH